MPGWLKAFEPLKGAEGKYFIQTQTNFLELFITKEQLRVAIVLTSAQGRGYLRNCAVAIHSKLLEEQVGNDDRASPVNQSCTTTLVQGLLKTHTNEAPKSKSFTVPPAIQAIFRHLR